MTAPAFTPGPWEAAERGDYSDYDGNSRVILGDEMRIAVVQHHGTERDDANARLIAAAPEMFAALEASRSMFDEYAELHRRKIGTAEAATPAKMEAVLRKVERNVEMRNLCEDALAKARGEQ